MDRSEKAGFLFFICIIAFIYFLYSIIRYKLFFMKAIFVKGKVINHREHIDWWNRRKFFNARGIVSYAPVIEFEYNGVVRTIEGKHYSKFKPAYGKEISVGINPNNIEDARLEEPDYIMHMYQAAILSGVYIFCAFSYYMSRYASSYWLL